MNKMSEETPGDLAGRRIGGYVIASLLGAGGMGEVYRAHDTTWAYWPSERGIYYVARPSETRPPYTYRVMMWEPSIGKSRLLSEFTAEALGPSLQASRDGNSLLLAGVASLNIDLMLIENFR